MLATIAGRCRRKLATRFRLYLWLVFNVLTGNSDTHLKNLSFLVDAEGVDLAPHHDLLCTVCYESKAYGRNDWPMASTLAWPILGAERFGDLRFDHLVAAGQALGLQCKATTNIVSLILLDIMDEALRLLGEVDAENAVLGRNPLLGPTLEGEMRCLRTIVHVVLREMVTQLSR